MNGQYLRTASSKGTNPNEPIEMSSDKEGNILVADFGYKRIQVFSPDLRHMCSFGEAYLSEPHNVLQLENGNLMINDYGGKVITVGDP